MARNASEYEKLVAQNINAIASSEGIVGLKAEQSTRGAQFSDIIVTYQATRSPLWIEVKMDHSAQLGSPRFYFDKYKWGTTYTTPMATEIVKMLNVKGSPALNFIEDLKNFIFGDLERLFAYQRKYPFLFTDDVDKAKNLDISLGNRRAVSREPVPKKIIEDYFATKSNQYIYTKDDYNIGELVIAHYLYGKKDPAHYMQVGDDFYFVGNGNPLLLRPSPACPHFTARGPIKVRFSIRSRGYEIQTEIKSTSSPLVSPYSLKPGSKKPHPFIFQ